MRRPEKSEYAEFYTGYIDSVPEADVLSVLREQADELSSVFGNIPEERGNYAYQNGKWTVKQLLGHLIDGERVFGYRLHRFSHGDPTPLAGFDQDVFVTNGRSNVRSIADLLDEFITQRRSNLALIASLSDEDWDLRGTASGAEVTVRALAFIMAGHVRHHLRIINERYLS
ncbi:DinB family protein [Leptolyngbya sp. 7M]|uniref:DinB family protein n=1 Tax=Leptolyngbya sp. 7M TaxID=2812896 RepID=UPI001B8BB2F7|nr:DinB family protein [Leptolyngbya sp. 7M]QYO67016.1 DinB family protein [Leptolyngbya sp. 7M]